MTTMTATDIVQRIHNRETTATDVANTFLAQIETYDHLVKAYATVNADMVRAQAAWLDRQRKDGAKLPLHGIPVGVKDIIDVAGLPTIAGFEPYRDRIAERDAAIIAALREAGALILGKTHTTQFASGDPAPTRNPWNLSKSPAGSSAGSGAAVPARMAAIALGSQTGGSMLRPAAFNGSVGFKPTYGWISVEGVLPLCWSLDHLGLYGTTVDDVSLVFDTLTGAHDEPAAAGPTPPRIALLTEFLELSEPEVATHIEDVAGKLEQAGATVVRTTLPVPLAHIQAVHQVIFGAEIAAVHSANIVQHTEHYAPNIRTTAEVGSMLPAAYVLQARRHRRTLQAAVDRFLLGFDALILPTVGNEACDPETTGNSRFQAPFTLLGTPAISLPTGLSPNELPLGTQLVGRRGGDRGLLSVARWAAETVQLIGKPDLEGLKQS